MDAWLQTVLAFRVIGIGFHAAGWESAPTGVDAGLIRAVKPSGIT